MEDKKEVYVIKANGEREVFDKNKLKISLQKAGSDDQSIHTIVEQVEQKLKDGMTTSEIYRMAFSMLEKLEKHTSVKYSLRKAIMDLGPSGFPFEDYIGELFKATGYNTQVGVIVKGFCVEHEVDIIARNNEKLITAELKFHNQTGTKSDLQVALYVKSRFDDLDKGGFYERESKGLPHEGWLITNTKFTENAIQYAKCSGITVMGWNYPREGNLQQLIEKIGLHPITALTSLNSAEKNKLLQNGIVLCRQIKNGGGDLLIPMGFKKSKVKSILDEVDLLCAFFHKE